MVERKNLLTEYGLAVRKKLLDINKTPTWLCAEVASRGNCYMDTQYLNKILTGQASSRKKIELIDAILQEAENVH